MTNGTGMSGKVIVSVYPPDMASLADSLEAAVQFAYRTGSVVEFIYGGRCFRAWYQDIHGEAESHRAVFREGGNWVDVPRDHGRWGSFVNVS